MFEGTKAELRPSQNKFSGTAIGSPTTLTVSALYMTTHQINGPFAGLVDAVLGVKSSTPAADTEEWMDAEVRVTLFFT